MSRVDHMLVSLAKVEDKPCEDDTRYIMDRPSRRDVIAMQALCQECPVLDLCAEVAELFPPQAGVWAGVSYNRQGPSRRGDYGSE